MFINDLMKKFPLWWEANGPAVALGAGCGFSILGAIESGKGAVKVHDELPAIKADILTQRKLMEENKKENQPVGDQVKEIAKLYGKSCLTVTRHFVPAVLLEACSIGCVCWSGSKQDAQIAGLSAGYMALSASYGEYQKRVRQVLGEDKEKELRNGIKTEKIVATQTDEEGNETTEEKKAYIRNAMPCGPYFFMFDQDSSKEWDQNADYNFTRIKLSQKALNEKLCRQGYLFLKDVFDELGWNEQLRPREVNDFVYGWVYDPEDPNCSNYVDFGVFDKYGCVKPNIITDDGEPIPLEINVDGPIIAKCRKMKLLV